MDSAAPLIGLGVFCALAAIAFPLTWSPRDISTFTYAEHFDDPIAFDNLDNELKNPDLSPACTLIFDTTPAAMPALPTPDTSAASADTKLEAEPVPAPAPRPNVISFFRRFARTKTTAPAALDASESATIDSTGADAVAANIPDVAAVDSIQPVIPTPVIADVTASTAESERALILGTPPERVLTTVRSHAEAPTPDPREGGDSIIDATAGPLTETNFMKSANPFARLFAPITKLMRRRPEPAPAPLLLEGDDDPFAREPDRPLGVNLTFAGDAIPTEAVASTIATDLAREKQAEPPAPPAAAVTTDAQTDEAAASKPGDAVTMISSYMQRNRTRSTSAVDTTAQRFVEERATPLTGTFTWVREAMHAEEPVTLDINRRRRLLNLYGSVQIPANAAMLRRIIDEDPELAPDAERLLQANG